MGSCTVETDDGGRAEDFRWLLVVKAMARERETRRDMSNWNAATTVDAQERTDGMQRCSLSSRYGALDKSE
jgi:hypothetical protein